MESAGRAGWKADAAYGFRPPFRDRGSRGDRPPRQPIRAPPAAPARPRAWGRRHLARLESVPQGSGCGDRTMAVSTRCAGAGAPERQCAAPSTDPDRRWPGGRLSSTAVTRPSDRYRVASTPRFPDRRASHRESSRRCHDLPHRVRRSPAASGNHCAVADSLSRSRAGADAPGHGCVLRPHGRCDCLRADPSGGPPLTSITWMEIFRASSSGSTASNCRSSSRGSPGRTADGWGCVWPVPNQNTT